MLRLNFQVSGLGGQVSGTGIQVRVQVRDGSFLPPATWGRHLPPENVCLPTFVLSPEFPVPAPVPGYPNLYPETRDLGPENVFALQLGQHAVLTLPSKQRMRCHRIPTHAFLVNLPAGQHANQRCLATLPRTTLPRGEFLCRR